MTMTERRVTAAIVIKEKRVLVARRAPGQKNEGLWEFPGGKVEKGESDQACLAREMQEEFGVRGQTLAHLCDSRYVYGAQGEAILLCAYMFDWQEGAFELRVHDKLCWADAQMLSALTLSPADIPVAETVAKLL